MTASGTDAAVANFSGRVRACIGTRLTRLACPVVVSYGDQESPEFQRQAREFAAAVERIGKLDRLLVGGRYNHFEIVETLANPYGLLGRAALDLMKLAPPGA